MLVELAVGDAYGAGFEYADTEFVRAHNTLSAYVQHPRHHGMKPGHYSDDAQMSIAVTEVIISGLPWTQKNLADSFVRCFRRDKREGYARGFYSFLCSVRNGDDFLARIKPDSDKSGAAMRAIPVGIYPTIPEVISRCTLQAAITHDTPDGINAAVAAALSSHYFLYRLGRKRDLGRFLEDNVPGQWAEPWSGKVGSKGWMSVRAAVTAIHSCSRMSDLLRFCVDFTGDVDTVATIALGAASASSEVKQDLPAHLHCGLENGRYGLYYLSRLDSRLGQRMQELGCADRGRRSSTSTAD